MDQAVTYNYVCFFSNGTFKIGITQQPTKRLANYVREASRFCQSVTGYWVSCPRDDGRARLLEATVKRVYADCAVPRHRETFDGRKAIGHIVVKSLGLSKTEKAHAPKSARAFYARFGKAQASTAGQRSVIVASVLRSRAGA